MICKNIYNIYVEIVYMIKYVDFFMDDESTTWYVNNTLAI